MPISHRWSSIDQLSRYHVDHQAIVGACIFSAATTTAAYHLPHKYRTTDTMVQPVQPTIPACALGYACSDKDIR